MLGDSVRVIVVRIYKKRGDSGFYEWEIPGLNRYLECEGKCRVE